ncbi:cytochrome b [uncultured Lamprocystis sp.]|jgi:cytochrome b561|uniref:cytochrome b n=1 Tax=uncultured Lamprocystis sp. TaxID=543132 RepID=UPI0025DD272E|nr:cytochrome b [uncultured Lamprocystis sp.]
MSSTTPYSTPAKLAHWLIAALILAAFPLGLYMHELSLSPEKLRLYSYHKWIGMTVLLLFMPRLLWRLVRPPPALLPGPAWQLKLAEATHWLLYLLMAAVPLCGWLMSSAKGFQVVYLGLVPLPDLVGKDQALGTLLADLHSSLAWALMVLIVVHAAAALKHHLIDRDDTLRRILPFVKLPSGETRS